MASVANQRAQKVPSSPPESWHCRQAPHLPSFYRGCWGSELRILMLEEKHFIHPVVLTGPRLSDQLC